jgi:hypothetical protein
MEGKIVPQRLKPTIYGPLYGTAKLAAASGKTWLWKIEG